MFKILVATLILKDNKVLLVKETKEEFKGLLNLPAGHLESNETLTQGAIREVKEETGLDVKINQLIDTEYFKKGEVDCVSFVFTGEIVNNEKETNELEYDFYDIEYIKNNTEKLRNGKLILKAIEKMNIGSKSAVNILG